MFENQKTTIVAVVTAFFAFVVFSPEHFKAVPWLVDLSKFAAVGGLAALGVVSADAKKAPPPDEPKSE
jgi:hypothetical protein